MWYSIDLRPLLAHAVCVGGGIHDCFDHQEDQGPLHYCQGQRTDKAIVQECPCTSGMTPCASDVRICASCAELVVQLLKLYLLILAGFSLVCYLF